MGGNQAKNERRFFLTPALRRLSDTEFPVVQFYSDICLPQDCHISNPAANGVPKLFILLPEYRFEGSHDSPQV